MMKYCCLDNNSVLCLVILFNTVLILLWWVLLCWLVLLYYCCVTLSCLSVITYNTGLCFIKVFCVITLCCCYMSYVSVFVILRACCVHFIMIVCVLLCLSTYFYLRTISITIVLQRYNVCFSK